MFNSQEIKQYEKDFIQLGITDTNIMLGILNTLDQLAEITYLINKKNYD